MAFEFVDLNTLRSVPDLASYQKSVRGRITDLNTEHAGVPFPEEIREEYAKLKDTDSDTEKRIVELEARKRDVERIGKNESNVEREADVFSSAAARGTRKERDVYEISDMRVNPLDPGAAAQEFRDRALKAIEASHFPQARRNGKTEAEIRSHVEGMLERDTADGWLARDILLTGSPAYRRAWAKFMTGKPVMSFSGEESRAVERAFTLGSTGLPVPYQLDPTLIPTSNFSVNPWRAISSVEQIVVNEWRGATSGAITAAYAAEGTEASDNTPTLTQPSVLAVRAQAFVPFSIEVSQDWGAIESEMAQLIADAKDDLESNKFFSGSGTNEPFGLNAATSAVDSATAGAAAFVIADLFTMESALAPRFRPRASVVANRAQYNRVRQFDTAGGAGLWLYIADQLNHGVPTPGRTGASLLGYPAYESSQMLAVLTTGSRIMVIGDFSYYKIVDRVGMSIEVIPHLFGSGNRYPTGQRGLYAMWRNGGKILAETAFRFLKTA